MFSRLKRLGTSSSHAGGSRSEAAAAAAVTVTFSLTNPGPADLADIAIPDSRSHDVSKLISKTLLACNCLGAKTQRQSRRLK